MTPTGQLERAVLDVLWTSKGPVTAKDVVAALPDRDLAVTTVLTVLDRLGQKGLVDRERDGRAHRYRASVTREDYVADLMLEALGQAPDRDAVLNRFLGGARRADVAFMRRALVDDTDTWHHGERPPGPDGTGGPGGTTAGDAAS